MGRRVTPGIVGEVLQRLYDSELHAQLGWQWDAGVDFQVEVNSPNVWTADPKAHPVVETNQRDVAAGVQLMAETAVERFPLSALAAWWGMPPGAAADSA